MKKQPKAVYIIENGGYTELTYEEFRRREQICPLYADKLFLPLYGRLMEVTKEDSPAWLPNRKACPYRRICGGVIKREWNPANLTAALRLTASTF